MATKRYVLTMELEVEDNDAAEVYMHSLTHHIDRLIDPNTMDPIKAIHDVQLFLCDKDRVRELHRNHLASRFNEVLTIHALACQTDDREEYSAYVTESSILCKQLFSSLERYIDDKLNQYKHETVHN